MKHPDYEFIKTAARIINAGQTRSLVLSGNITDLFYSEGPDGADYVPLVDVLINRWSVSSNVVVIYELNGPIRFLSPSDAQKMKDAWNKLHQENNQHAIDLALARTKKQLEALKRNTSSPFDEHLRKAKGNPTYALELLRQMCLCSRLEQDGVPFLWEDLVIIIEGAEFLIPEGEVSRLSDIDRQRVAICRDWFSDPAFMNGGDSAILLTESASLINNKIFGLPQVLNVEVPSPNDTQRLHLIRWYNRKEPDERELKLWSTQETLSRMTAGLTIHALMQLLRYNSHTNERLQPEDVVAKVEEFIQDQLGDDVVEFKKPSHSLKDVVGFRKLKKFLVAEFIPRVRSTGKSALPGAAVGGPIGAGKSYLLEAVAGELDVPVLVLKNIRSKWFGGTDALFERLRRIIYALDKSLIFVDEADTQFGGVSNNTHATERRLTGKIQAMMADPALRGKTCWLLITARIHLLSADLRRPGRAGSLIIPILDPAGEDLEDFVAWMIRPVFKRTADCERISDAVQRLLPQVRGYYAAVFAEVRANLQATVELRGQTSLSIENIEEILADHIPPAVKETRDYQRLQVLLNCTRRSLLPEDTAGQDIQTLRAHWRMEIAKL